MVCTPCQERQPPTAEMVSTAMTAGGVTSAAAVGVARKALQAARSEDRIFVMMFSTLLCLCDIGFASQEVAQPRLAEHEDCHSCFNNKPCSRPCRGSFLQSVRPVSNLARDVVAEHSFAWERCVLISCQEQPAHEAARFEDRIVVHDGLDIVVSVEHFVETVCTPCQEKQPQAAQSEDRIVVMMVSTLLRLCDNGVASQESDLAKHPVCQKCVRDLVAVHSCRV